MAERVVKMPDIGEGITEAEISEWLVEVGDLVAEDDGLVEVLTDKATVEIPSSVSGRVTWRAGEPGDRLAVGAALLKIDVDGAGEAEAAPTPDAEPTREHAPEPQAADPRAPADIEIPEAGPERAGASDADRGEERPRPSGRRRGRGAQVLAAPAVRARAVELGLDLSTIDGTGPEGRVTHADLDRRLRAAGPAVPPGATTEATETKVIGLRRRIAEQMALSHARIPQITIVEEVDVTEVERLRAQMNADRGEDRPKLTLLPFVVRAMIAARPAAPVVNSRYDDDAGIVRSYEAVHVGIAAQTAKGLTVPVLRHAEARSVRALGAAIARLAAEARDGSLDRAEMTGATITVTSLGPLGAVATTPIVNHPEVAIVGVNRKRMAPVWDGHAFQPREVMNLSASFDHRVVDGWDAALYVARLKTVLEVPALMFA
jgi:2-oxoisovalerate dehydrogenase E2 component (dihydrolipoyl transacylase)